MLDEVVPVALAGGAAPVWFDDVVLCAFTRGDADSNATTDAVSSRSRFMLCTPIRWSETTAAVASHQSRGHFHECICCTGSRLVERTLCNATGKCAIATKPTASSASCRTKRAAAEG